MFVTSSETMLGQAYTFLGCTQWVIGYLYFHALVYDDDHFHIFPVLFLNTSQPIPLLCKLLLSVSDSCMQCFLQFKLAAHKLPIVTGTFSGVTDMVCVHCGGHAVADELHEYTT